MSDTDLTAIDVDEQAHNRAKFGLTRQAQQERSRRSDPSVGGARGYPVWHRVQEIIRADQGKENFSFPNVFSITHLFKIEVCQQSHLAHRFIVGKSGWLLSA